MKKELNFKPAFCLIMLIIFTININVFGQITYYVSNNGNDTNDGKSMATPWKTIRIIQPGNTYLLKCGDTFYFKINHVDNPLNQKITISSYSNGPKPIISLYKNIHSTAWQLYTTPNVYKVDLKMVGNNTGFLDTSDTNVGFLKVNGKIQGNKVNSIDMLSKNWDFFSDTQYLYVYAKVNPAANSTPIQIVINNTIITLSSNMTISNLSLDGTGAHGIQGSNVDNVVISNVDINEIGGSYLGNFGNGKIRYGNGIEFWMGASNCIVTGCKVTNVYDVAFTIQSTHPNSIFNNVIFDKNKADNNEQSFEFWVKDANSKIINCKFINNICSNAGYGWSHAVRPDQNVAVHLLSYYPNVSGNKNDVEISGNKFTNAKTNFSFAPKTVGNQDKLFQLEKNITSK